MSVLYMVFVYFDTLKPNPGFILPVHPSKNEKLVKNCENKKKLRKIMKIRMKKHRLKQNIFYKCIIHDFCVFWLAKFKSRVYFSPTPFNLCKNSGKLWTIEKNYGISWKFAFNSITSLQYISLWESHVWFMWILGV